MLVHRHYAVAPATTFLNNHKINTRSSQYDMLTIPCVRTKQYDTQTVKLIVRALTSKLSTVSGQSLTWVIWVANGSLFTKFNILCLVCGTTTQNSPPSGVSGDSKGGPLQHQFLGV